MNPNEHLIEDGSDYADVEGLFEDKGGDGGMFLSIFDFSICQRSKTMVEGWEGPFSRKNPKTNEEVISYAKRYDRMVARIIDVTKHTKEFDASKGGGKVTNWNILLIAGGQKMTLQLTWIDSVLKRFLKVAPNINLEKPILISAFRSMKNGEAKQAVSFRQGEGKDLKTWTKVEEYWKRPVGPDGKTPIEGSSAVGADGTILPQPIHDEEDDSWDYKEQNKFLAKHFRDVTLPKIKAIAAKYGLDKQDSDESMPTHTGGAGPVTEKPADPLAHDMSDIASGTTLAEVKRVIGVFGWTPEAVVGKMFGPNISISELNEQAAGWMLYQLHELGKKRGVKTELAVSKSKQAPEPEDDGLDDLFSGPATPAATPAPAPAPAAAPADDDDIDWDD
jgi:hypothetical protein